MSWAKSSIYITLLKRILNLKYLTHNSKLNGHLSNNFTFFYKYANYNMNFASSIRIKFQWSYSLGKKIVDLIKLDFYKVCWGLKTFLGTHWYMMPFKKWPCTRMIVPLITFFHHLHPFLWPLGWGRSPLMGGWVWLRAGRPNAIASMHHVLATILVTFWPLMFTFRPSVPLLWPLIAFSPLQIKETTGSDLYHQVCCTLQERTIY